MNKHIAFLCLMTGTACFEPSLTYARMERRPSPSAEVATSERLITILATNDIHGGVEPKEIRGRGASGGLAFFSGVVQSIRTGLSARYQDRAGVLLVDAGDQFQGTLISNYNEGELLFSAFNQMGYDAVVPGNHDFDFGPEGWLEDRVTPGVGDQNPRGVLEKLARKAKFPLVSANTYLKASLVDQHGQVVPVSGNGCTPTQNSNSIQWDRAQRPDIFVPYVIKSVAGVRVALIGIDNPETPKITTSENVSDLCFRGEVETYEEVRAQLEGQADVFVLIMHNGDAINDSRISHLVRQLASRPNQVHGVVSGHTHLVFNKDVDGIPLIQSGSGGDKFGRIDFVWDVKKRALISRKTRSAAGIELFHHSCDKKAAFCAMAGDGQVRYEDIPVEVDTKIEQEVRKARQVISPLADRKIGYAKSPLYKDRISENPLADILTDAFRTYAHADIALLNMGGLRDKLPAGDVTYEDLFKVLPFNNHGVVVGPMPWGKIESLLKKSVKTCGAYGALLESGLRVTYSRNCSRARSGVDQQARLEHVETLDHEVLFDSNGGAAIHPQRLFQVATLDFLVLGGGGYDEFNGIPFVRDWGILREVLSENFISQPPVWEGEIDGRWTNLSQ